jgi:hypothetical protein
MMDIVKLFELPEKIRDKELELFSLKQDLNTIKLKEQLAVDLIKKDVYGSKLYQNQEKRDLELRFRLGNAEDYKETKEEMSRKRKLISLGEIELDYLKNLFKSFEIFRRY